MEILKITITNSVNDNAYSSYYVVKNEDEKQEKIAKHKAEVSDWNSPGPGKMSYRDMDVEVTDVENATLSDLIGLPLMDVVLILDALK
jgi:hypothetical protein